MHPTPARRAALGLTAAAVVVGLAACSSPTDLGEEVASHAVQSLLDDLAFESYAPDIVEFARRAEAATEQGPIMMLDVEEGDASARNGGEPIGWITFGLTVSDTRRAEGYWDSDREQDPGPSCYRVMFDHWGAQDIRGADCPDTLEEVPAPPSQQPEIAANAEEAVWSVLQALPEDPPSEDEIVAEVTALLEPHDNDVTPLAEVTAHVEGTSVAVATGDAHDCVLVGRFQGEVRDVDVPSVYLLPGELGCTADTAFADLRPPH